MRSRSILSGVNVPIEPTSNVDNRLTNNITITNKISNDDAPEIKAEYKAERALPSSLQGGETSNPYEGIQTRSAVDSETSLTVEAYLLRLYQNILLNQNKKLLANILSRNEIILSATDLAELVKLKIKTTGIECSIVYEDYEVSCLNRNSFIRKVESIRIMKPDGTVVDFKIEFNKEYLELVNSYHVSMKYVMPTD